MQNRMKHFQLTKEEIDALLERAAIGRFGTVRGDGYPYVTAMHFVYYNETIYMHGLPKGLKIDNVKANPKVSFTSMEPTGKYTVRIIGTATFITDPAEKEKAYAKLGNIVKGIYTSWNDPTLEIFYVSNGELKFATGFNPAEIIKF